MITKVKLNWNMDKLTYTPLLCKDIYILFGLLWLYFFVRNAHTNALSLGGTAGNATGRLNILMFKGSQLATFRP